MIEADDPWWTERHTACGITWDQLDIVRFLSKVVNTINPKSSYGFCRVWQGAKSRGKGNKRWYGSFRVKGKTVRAHKFYAVVILGLRSGPDDHLDHECQNSICVSCIECVPKEVNLKRRWSRA